MKKYTIIVILTGILVIPIFFGIYTDFLFIRRFDLFIVLSLILGFFLFLLLGWILNSISFDKKDLELMRKHNVILALINDDKKILWFFFPITMIMEELIFRYYILSFLFLTLQMGIIQSILLASLAFSLYHIHTWFSYKSLKILSTNLVFTFLLGLFNGSTFFTIGIIPCVIIHYLIAFFLYYNLFRMNYRNLGN